MVNRMFIVGYMGAGKTTSGRRLAKLMGLPFFDMDVELRAQSGMSIPELFNANGESGFREREHQVLQKLVEAHPEALISTGGGAPCHSDNMSYMLEQGAVVYFKMSPERLAERLAGRVDERPLISGVRPEDLPRFIRKHLEEREVHYSRAHVTVDAEHLDMDRLKSIRNLVEGRNWFSP